MNARNENNYESEYNHYLTEKLKEIKSNDTDFFQYLKNWYELAERENRNNMSENFILNLPRAKLHINSLYGSSGGLHNGLKAELSIDEINFCLTDTKKSHTRSNKKVIKNIKKI